MTDNYKKIDLSAIKDPAAVEIIKYLLAENAQLRAEVRQLQEKVARLEKNSSTSSKPPSSDITKPKHEQRQPGERKAGGQPGHKGMKRELLPADKVENLDLHECPDCGEQLNEKREEEARIHQTIELKENPVEVTEYRQHGHRCPNCQIVHYKPLPVGVDTGQLFGPRLQALMAYMKGNLGASYTELQQYCKDVLGIHVSSGMLCKLIARTKTALEGPYNGLVQAIPEQERLNIDESGWKDSGKQYWVWLFCTELLALFSVNQSRGSKVLRQILGDSFGGAIMSDFFSAYVSYASPKQQFCLAHLIRDIKFLETLPQKRTKNFAKRLLGDFRSIFEQWHVRDKTPPEIFKQQTQKSLKRMLARLKSNNATVGYVPALRKRLLKHWPSLFRFLDDPTLYDPTNNLAERTLRPLVRIRRQTQGSRSAWGQLWISCILSTIVTCRKQNRSAFIFIHDAIIALSHGTTPPSLLPA